MLGDKINSARKLTVPGRYGRSIDVKKGQYVTVRDIEGGQCGDFWAIDANDFDHFLSPTTHVDTPWMDSTPHRR